MWDFVCVCVRVHKSYKRNSHLWRTSLQYCSYAEDYGSVSPKYLCGWISKGRTELMQGMNIFLSFQYQISLTSDISTRLWLILRSQICRKKKKTKRYLWCHAHCALLLIWVQLPVSKTTGFIWLQKQQQKWSHISIKEQSPLPPLPSPHTQRAESALTGQ